MTTPSAEAADALAAMRQSRAELAALANCPPARHAAFAGLLGGLVACQAAPVTITLGLEAVLLAGVALLVQWDRRRTGMFINGYRAGRTRKVTFSLLAFTLAALALGLWLKLEQGIIWAPLACGAVVTAVAWFASSAWQRIYRRELTETPVTQPGFDPVIHAPARLQIMAVLAGVQDAEFALLRQTVKVSDSVLSKHLSQLADAGYVRLRKAAADGRQRTWASLTREGRAAFAAHVKALEALAAVVDQMAAE